jgi:Xaa-Pro aminopeptidase
MRNRINKLKEAISLKGIDNFLVSKPENQVYLTGFPSSNCHLIFTRENNFLLTDFRYIEAARELSPLYNIILIDAEITLFSFLKEMGLKELAIEESYITYKEYKRLQEEVGCSLVPGDGIVEDIRVIKDAAEIEAIKKAQNIADKGFLHMINYLKPGIREREAALELEIFLRKEGALALSFDTILISGTRTSLPHGTPTDKYLEEGDFVTMDFGCVVGGYCSDMTRTVALGKVSHEQREVNEIVLEAQRAGCSAIKAGVSCKDADKACRDIISQKGYGEFFGHGTGHGVGMEVHEKPTLNSRSAETLKENMVVTIEPGIYLPQKFGVRIEDLAIVTASGIINLVESEKELIII